MVIIILPLVSKKFINFFDFLSFINPSDATVGHNNIGTIFFVYLMNSSKIIVALDSNNLNKILKHVRTLKEHVYAFKIGYEFFFNFKGGVKFTSDKFFFKISVSYTRIN